jgi:hypothetical protein
LARCICRSMTGPVTKGIITSDTYPRDNARAAYRCRWACALGSPYGADQGRPFVFLRGRPSFPECPFRRRPLLWTSIRWRNGPAAAGLARKCGHPSE